MAFSSSLKSFIGLTETGPLIVEPVTRESLALQISTVVNTDGQAFRFPRIVSDPSAAWTPENTEIVVSEATADEVVVIPRKVAGLSIISNELANDSSPEAAGVIGAGLARDIASKIDAAYFGTAPATDLVQPGGLEYLGDDVTQIDADPASGLDAYIDALAAAEGYGIDLSAFVVDPATAQALAKITAGTGSNQKLFGSGPANGIERNVLGLPLLVSPHVLPGTGWGIPTSRAYTVLRTDVTLQVDSSVFFTRDQTAVRAVMRIGFGFIQPAAIVKIKLSV